LLDLSRLLSDAEISNPVLTGILETQGTMGVQKTAKNHKKRQTKHSFDRSIRTLKRIIFFQR
jgi:hypothetical protein